MPSAACTCREQGFQVPRSTQHAPDLNSIAARRNVTVEQLLAKPPQSWQPPKPFAALPELVQIAATNWRDALAQPTARHREISGRELRELARKECRRVFGRDISDATWWKYFDLAAKRDSGFEQGARVELFVADSVCAASPALTTVLEQHLAVRRCEASDCSSALPAPGRAASPRT